MANADSGETIRLKGGPLDGRTFEPTLDAGIIGVRLVAPLFEGRKLVGYTPEGTALYSYPQAVYNRDGTYSHTESARA